MRDVGGGRQLKTSRASACGTGVHAAGHGRLPGGVRERRVDGRVRRRVRDVGGDRGRRRQIMGSAVYALCSAATRPECGVPNRFSKIESWMILKIESWMILKKPITKHIAASTHSYNRHADGGGTVEAT